MKRFLLRDNAPRIRRRRRAEEGFSLIELIVGVTLLSVLMLGFLPIFPLGVRSVERGNHISVATDLAQDQLEQVKGLEWDDPGLMPGIHADPLNPIDGVYRRTWTVFDNEPIAGMRRVDVTVTFTEPSGPRSIVLSTHVKN